MNAVNEAFAPILASIADQSLMLRKAAYKTALQAHDWTFEWSDDAKSVEAGRQSLKFLVAERAEIDPDGAIWNSVAPHGFKVGGAQ